MLNNAVFQKISDIGVSLYLLANDRCPNNYNIYYYVSEDLGNVLTLHQTFISNGCYVFAKGHISDLPQFYKSLQDFLSLPNNKKILLLWIENPEANEKNWIYNSISYTSKTSNQIFINAPVLLNVSNQTINMVENQNTPIYIQLSEDQNSLSVGSNFLGFYQIKIDQTDIKSYFGDALIHFSGAIAGCLEFSTVFAPKDVSLKFFFDTSNVSGALTSFTYPLFSDAGNPVSFRVLNDLLNPTNPNRTLFAFMESPALPSYFRTNTGRDIMLTPYLTGNVNNLSSSARAKLVLAVNPSNKVSNNKDPYYVTISGAYTISTNPVVKHQQLQCGLSALENIGFESGVTQIYFLPGVSAYAPHYPFSSESMMTIDPSSVLLSPIAKTSWGYLSSRTSDNLNYFSQSEGSPLYAKIVEQAIENEKPILDYIEIPAHGLPPVSPDPYASFITFPIVPYAGVSDKFKAQQYQALEHQVLNPVRQKQITNLHAPPGPLGYSVKCLSPQGYLVTLNGENPYSWEDFIPFRTQGRSFTFSNIKPRFQQALQSNQLFLVVSSKEKFKTNGAELKEAIVKIKDNSSDKFWQFSLSPENWFQEEDHHTMIIFKFSGTSLYQMAQNTLLWTDANNFNDNVIDIQTELLDILQNAKDNVKIVPEFAPFVTMIDDPKWQGILLLNAKVSFEGEAPPSLKLLQSGLSPNYLYAHHLGINVTPVHFDDQQNLIQNDSSVFGLIDYDASREKINYQGVSYQFKVEHLKGFIQQSQLQSLSTQISLYMLYFFGEEVSVSNDANTRGSLLYLDGTYQNGSFSFIQPITNPVLKAHSHVIDEIELMQMRLGFTNLASKDTEGQIIFQFGGQLRFKQLFNGAVPSPFDVLSFGNDGNDPTREGGVSFSNLNLIISYDYKNLTKQSFQIDASQVTLNSSQSLARAKSLYQHFPLTLKSFIQSNDNSPQGLGYSSVLTPSLNQSFLSYPWYGIQYELNLGTMGDLAKQADLTVDFMVGWAPSPESPNIFVGIKIPGVDNSNQDLLSIQNVLKLSIQNLQLSVDEHANYILAFKNIALKFFGQSLPPSGQTNITLFGDPNATGDNATLGWYAAYAKRNAL